MKYQQQTEACQNIHGMATSEMEQEPEIMMWLGRLSEKTRWLCEQQEMIRARLSPICSVEVPCAENAKEPEPLRNNSPIAEEVRSLAMRIDRLLDANSELLSRIEI